MRQNGFKNFVCTVLCILWLFIRPILRLIGFLGSRLASLLLSLLLLNFLMLGVMNGFADSWDTIGVATMLVFGVAFLFTLLEQISKELPKRFSDDNSKAENFK